MRRTTEIFTCDICGGRVDALKTAEDCLEAFKRDKNTELAPPTAAKA